MCTFAENEIMLVTSMKAEPKILLIKPSGPKKFVPYVPLGIGYLTAMLIEHGITSIEVLDLELKYMEEDEFIERIQNIDPDIVGFSCMTCSYLPALHFASLVKKANSDIITVFGGPHPTFQSRETLQHSDAVDIVVRGEGEYTFRELVQNLKNKESLSAIQGISYRANGDIIETPNRPFIQDLDALPLPARDIVGIENYHETVRGYLITSRGCPWNCLYCSTSQFNGHKFRARRPECVVDEMQILVEEYGCKKVGVADDLFTFDRERVIGICDMILDRDLKMEWGCSVRADTFDRELLEKMHEAGCTILFIGIETLDDDVMKHIRKGLKVEKVKKALMLAKEVGFKIKASFILGLPFQKPEEGEAIMNFAEEVGLNPPLDLITVNMLCAFPGTDLYDDPGKYGIRITNQNWTLYNGLNCVTESVTFPREQVIDSFLKIAENNFKELKWSKIDIGGI